jgi:hypothetical protein
MRITFSSLAAAVLLLAVSLAPRKVSAHNTSKCLYNDEHFHVQDFKAEGPHFTEIMKMMDDHLCCTTLMSLAVTVVPKPDRMRVDLLMSAPNLKDARAGEYIKKMVHLYLGFGAALARSISWA